LVSTKKTRSKPSLLAVAQRELRAQLRLIKSYRRTEVFDKDMSMAAAALGRAITALAAEQRQQEKHAREVVARMSEDELDAVLRTHLEGLPVERRRAFRDWLDGLDAAGSVL
jgi:hypothetical protein